MIVSHPSNLARLIEFYGGHIYDERDGKTKRITLAGKIDKMPNLEEMREDIYSASISNELYYKTIRSVYDKYNIILDPHGAVGWSSYEEYKKGDHSEPAVIYETADPGKFPEDIERAIGVHPEVPEGIRRQQSIEERIFRIETPSWTDDTGAKGMSEKQYIEVKEKIKILFKGNR